MVSLWILIFPQNIGFHGNLFYTSRLRHLRIFSKGNLNREKETQWPVATGYKEIFYFVPCAEQKTYSKIRMKPHFEASAVAMG